MPFMMYLCVRRFFLAALVFFALVSVGSFDRGVAFAQTEEPSSVQDYLDSIFDSGGELDAGADDGDKQDASLEEFFVNTRTFSLEPETSISRVSRFPVYVYFRDVATLSKPINDLPVRLLGVEGVADTSGEGYVFINHLVPGGDILLASGDDVRYKRMLHEVTLPYSGEYSESIPWAVTLGQISTNNFARWLRLVGEREDANAGHLCGKVKYSGVSGARGQGYRVSIFQKPQKPLYFDAYGNPDPKLTATSVSGAFCFFNVSVGEALLRASFHDTSAPLTMMTSVSKGFVTSIALQNDPLSRTLSLTYAYGEVLPTFGDGDSQLSLEKPSLYPRPLHLIEGALSSSPISPRVVEGFAADVIGLWQSHTLNFSVRSLARRLHLTTIDASWEPMLISVGLQHKAIHPIAVYKQGVMGRLAHQLGMEYRSYLSSLLVTHGLRSQFYGMPLRMELWNEQGLVKSQDWMYMGSDGVMRGAFFNLSPGRYIWVLKGQETGYWVSSRMVRVLPGMHNSIHSGRQYVLDHFLQNDL